MVETKTLNIRIIDFGSACFGRSCNLNSITGTTSYYAPPESAYAPRRFFAHARLDQNINLKQAFAVDAWSIGCIIFFILAGENLANVQSRNEPGQYLDYPFDIDDDKTLDGSVILAKQRAKGIKQNLSVWLQNNPNNRPTINLHPPSWTITNKNLSFSINGHPFTH